MPNATAPYVPYEPETGPTALQYVNYDSSTGIIDPSSRVYRRNFGDVAALLDEGYRVSGPVQGWGEFTHLIQVGSGGWALATFTP